MPILPNGLRPRALIPDARTSVAAVTGAIRRAAQSTGANFDYLLTTAKVESNLDPNSTISTSTTTGGQGLRLRAVR